MPASKPAPATPKAPARAGRALRAGADPAPAAGLPVRSNGRTAMEVSAAADEAPDLSDPALLADPSAGEPLVHHPDGWYWLSPDGHERFGPFATQAEALADLNAAELDELAPDELLSEAEAEIGIADWIDPDTGEPAEGQGAPHLPPD